MQTHVSKAWMNVSKINNVSKGDSGFFFPYFYFSLTADSSLPIERCEYLGKCYVGTEVCKNRVI